MPNKKTIIIRGVPASPGIAFGEAKVIHNWEQSIKERSIKPSEVENEIALLDEAVEKTLLELNKSRRAASRKIGGPVAKIFDSQVMIASDQDFLKKVRAKVKSSLKNAEFIYGIMIEESVMPLRRSKDQYLRQMVNDIEAVSQRIIRHLAGREEQNISQFLGNYIFVGKLFTPAEVLNLCEKNARAIVTSEGSSNSHMALIVRSLIVPSVVAARRADLRIKTGDQLIIDGYTGQITVNPPDDEWQALVERENELKELPITKLRQLPAFPPRTKDEIKINLSANIDLSGPLDRVLSKQKVGIGLYRTEFQYLQHGQYPSEEKQFELYDSISKIYYPQSIVIRTFDIGSDKFLQNDNTTPENNPALGWRGIRASLSSSRIFSNQLRAILRASARRNISILLPMITDITELRRFHLFIKRVMTELGKEKIDFDESIKIGIMIEVPAAALTSDILAEKADFFSIGSNDLTQYTLAADRDNQKLAKIFNPLHPSVLRLIKLSVDSAKRHNIPISVCGEMAGDPTIIPLLIGLGVDQLSMGPSRLYTASKLIAKIDYKETKGLASEIMRLKNTRQIEKRLSVFAKSLK